MKKLFTATLLPVLLFAASCNNDKPPGGNDSAGKDTLGGAEGIPAIPYNCYCADTSIRDSICPMIPHEVDFSPGLGYHSTLVGNIQPIFDEFSWQSFAAFNWPSDANGNPVGSFFSGTDSNRVWETYKDPGEVFYNLRGGLAGASSEAKKNGRKLFYMTSKVNPTGLGGGDIVMFDNFALVDRNQNFSLYEEKMNPDEVGYVNQNNLHTLKNIMTYANAHGKALDLPAGMYTDPAKHTGGQVGMVEFKAVWRILDVTKGDNPSRFYTQQADIFVPAANSVSGKEMIIKNVTVGMVAIHIIHKTNKFKDQVWSTFVHDDNNPDSLQYANKNYGTTNYSYFNPACTDCPVNTPVPAPDKVYKWNSVAPYASAYATKSGGQSYGNQVVQSFTIYPPTDLINAKWKKKLKSGNSVWANYTLLGSQWFIGTTNTPGGPDQPAPPILGNPMLETFILPGSDCIGCHKNAKVHQNGDTVTTDLSFLFGHAK